MDALGRDEMQNEQSMDSLAYPPGFEPNLSLVVEKSGEVSFPLGFKEPNTEEVRSGRKGNTHKRHNDQIGMRLTRSQTKQRTMPVTKSRRNVNRRGSSRGGKEGSPFENESPKTTDSIRKIAEEALEMVELLGIKVIANKENAVKRITQSLKSERALRAIHKSN